MKRATKRLGKIKALRASAEVNRSNMLFAIACGQAALAGKYAEMCAKFSRRAEAISQGER